MNDHKNNELINKVVDQYADTIIRIAFQYTKNRTDAEDITQDVFISLMKQPPFKTEEHLKAWLIRVTINKSKDYLRATKRRNTLPLDNFADILSKEEKLALDELNELPDKDHDLIYLFYFEEYTSKEIAKILGIEEVTIRKRLSRARGKLKKLLEET